MTDPPGRVGPPWSVQIELVEGCNRLCPFCGLNAIRTGPGGYQRMAIETMARIAQECASLAPHARYELAMHGEPLMHPQHLDLINLLRQALPKAQIQLTTNGRVLQRAMAQRLERLYMAGIDYVILDTYNPEREALQAEVWALDPARFFVRDFYRDCVPNGWSPWHNHRRAVQRTVIVMDDLGERSGEVRSRTITNHAGNSPSSPPLDEPLHRVCTLPFRELAINWDGGIDLCCNDWGHEYRAGNVNVQPLAAIWWGPAMEAARRVLYQRNRGFNPCVWCNMGSGNRPGLIPPYASPSPEDLDHIRQTVEASPRQNGKAPKFVLPLIAKEP